jgi:hypothetical protein
LAALVWAAPSSAFQAEPEVASVASDEATVQRARELVDRGAALVRESLVGRSSRALDAQAFAAFTEARLLLYPLTLRDAEDREITPAQRAFADALAWDGTLRVLHAERGRQVPAEYRDGSDTGLGWPADGPPSCMIRMHRPVRFPPNVEHDGRIAVVIVRVTFDANGQMMSAGVVSATGGDTVRAVVASSLARWTASYDIADPEGCFMPQSYFVRAQIGRG